MRFYQTLLCVVGQLLPLFCLAKGVEAQADKKNSPSVEEVLKAYDAIMGPPQFEATMSMVVNRTNGDKRTYKMRMKKKGDDFFRIWFEEPKVVKGQEILRRKDNNYLWVPSLKRPTQIAGRDDFQDGDFNNADVLRVNYSTDYGGSFLEGSSNAKPTGPEALTAAKNGKSLCLKLKAKHMDTSYDRIDLWVRSGDYQPLEAHFYGTSGKHLRTAVFSKVKELSKSYSRPTVIDMFNKEDPRRSSQMTVESMNIQTSLKDDIFHPSRLGRQEDK